MASRQTLAQTPCLAARRASVLRHQTMASTPSLMAIRQLSREAKPDAEDEIAYQAWKSSPARKSKYASDTKDTSERMPRPPVLIDGKNLTRTLYEAQTEAKQWPEWREFHTRHIGPRDDEIAEMLSQVSQGTGNEISTLDQLVSQVVPADVLQPPEQIVHSFQDEEGFTASFEQLMSENKRDVTWMNGKGYYPVPVPTVIQRNVLENPAWYTSYTPYQAEISQGRLESLLNYQTMVSDLTGLPVANASLLDEGTAAAEAMTMSLNCLPSSRAKRPNKTFVVSDQTHGQTIAVLAGRAEGFGINIKVMDLSTPNVEEKIRAIGDDLIGVMVQYPDTRGCVENFKGLADVVHDLGAQLSAATDLSALTLLTPPGEWGADIAFGNSQRFGVPMGYGGPHAAFFAVREANKRRLPGRLIGVSKDRLGRPALRLALQTREQHIRREKATSNVCTAQALLANMAAMYAVYHGPEQLRVMAIDSLRHARMIGDIATQYGLKVVTSSSGGILSDTITLQLKSPSQCHKLAGTIEHKNISVSVNIEQCQITLACPPNVAPSVLARLASSFRQYAQKNGSVDAKTLPITVWKSHFESSREDIVKSIPTPFRRESKYLTHPVFNSHHSETEMLRYIHHLQSKDLSQVHSMIPLGSCTMKLNGTSQLKLISNPQLSNVHPLAKLEWTKGYNVMAHILSKQLATLTGLDATSLQPNSGAQGEFAGLRVIRKYHESIGDQKRDICLIPVSAHGTNPASAAMAGMRTVPIKCDAGTGNLDIADLAAKCEKHKDELGAIMITYPSTFGVFEPDVRKACQIVHDHGGLVYMDGANMNAQIGLTSPGALGADVCHLNLHKTFCIPHGGGGPGVGPICVTDKLSPFLPHKAGNTPVASAPLGSASILPISWAYLNTMGDNGLRKATQVALLNANYLLTRLKDHYTVLYTNDQGRCAHEFILDIRPFTKTAGVEVADVAKRLQDYGFHAPTMSWPVPGTLMIEPTESESKEELDRFADAMISIREEIREIEEGKQPRQGNVLKNAPHPQIDLIMGDAGSGNWDRPYTREKAAYPLPWLKTHKFWPSVARVDDTYGDTNLFCTCPPVEDTTGEA